MGNKPKNGAGKVIKAIEGSGGIKQLIADRLKVHRNTVDNYLERYPTAQQAYDNEVEKVGDKAESIIQTALRNNDLQIAKWYAMNKLKDRGYAERKEFTGAEGNELKVSVEYVNSPIAATGTASRSGKD